MTAERTGGRAAPRKAMLLAAGRGTRLGSLTEATSKCMIPVAGKPLLEHTVEWVRRFGVVEVVVNVHHAADAVMRHFDDGRRWGVRITYSVERELLGTAGAVRNVAALFDDAFFVWYGDNLSTCRLDRLWAAHRASGSLATLALHHRADPTQSGIVALDDRDRITRFLEKPRPEQVFSHWVSAGILVLELATLAAIPPDGAPDFGRDVLPALLARGSALHGYRMSADEGLWWIDTPADLARVQATFARAQAVDEPPS